MKILTVVNAKMLVSYEICIVLKLTSLIKAFSSYVMKTNPTIQLKKNWIQEILDSFKLKNCSSFRNLKFKRQKNSDTGPGFQS